MNYSKHLLAITSGTLSASPIAVVDMQISRKRMMVDLKNLSKYIRLGAPLNGLCRMPLKTDTGWVLLETQTDTKGGLELVIRELAGLVQLGV